MEYVNKCTDSWWPKISPGLTKSVNNKIPFGEVQTYLAKALKLLEEGKYVEAWPLLEELANRYDNPEAHYQFGYLYYLPDKSLGIPQDLVKAAHHFEIAADRHNHPRAHYELAFFYNRGFGVPKDIKKSLEHYQAAADSGIYAAEFDMAAFYHHGFGVPQDSKEALRRYQIAAYNGVNQAWDRMCYIYQDTKNRYYDHDKAVRCFAIHESKVTFAIATKIKADETIIYSLKALPDVRNLFIALHRSMPDRAWHDFVYGTKSIEQCANNVQWLIALAKSNPCLVEGSDALGNNTSHYLSKDIAAVVIDILELKENEDPDITYGKLMILLAHIIDEDEKLDLHGVDLRGLDLTGLCASELVGADVRGAKSNDPDAIPLIKILEEYPVLQPLRGKL